MKYENAWKMFEKTGKITDYINYKTIQNSIIQNSTDNNELSFQNQIITANLNLRETDDNKNQGISN